MPAISSITIADATPTNHVFNPQSASIALSTWNENSANTYYGNSRIAIAMSPPTSVRKTTRVKISLTKPFERLVDDVYTVSDVAILTCEAVLPANCSASEIAHAYAMWKNLVAHATVQSYLADRSPVY